MRHDRHIMRVIKRFIALTPFCFRMIGDDGAVAGVVAGTAPPLNYNIPSHAPVVKGKPLLFKKSNTLFIKSKKHPFPSAFRKNQACSASASGSSFLRPISTMAMMMNCTTPQSMVSRGVPVL